METGSISATIESIKHTWDALVVCSRNNHRIIQNLKSFKEKKYQKLTNGLNFQERMQKT